MTAPAQAHGSVRVAGGRVGRTDEEEDQMNRPPEISPTILEDVKAVVVATLGLEDQADDLGPETAMHGNLAELDSLAAVKLLVALQRRFGIEIKMDEIAGDVFDTLGRLTAFVESKIGWESARDVDPLSATG